MKGYTAQLLCRTALTPPSGPLLYYTFPLSSLGSRPLVLLPPLYSTAATLHLPCTTALHPPFLFGELPVFSGRGRLATSDIKDTLASLLLLLLLCSLLAFHLHSIHSTIRERHTHTQWKGDPEYSHYHHLGLVGSNNQAAVKH